MTTTAPSPSGSARLAGPVLAVLAGLLLVACASRGPGAATAPTVPVADAWQLPAGADAATRGRLGAQAAGSAAAALAADDPLLRALIDSAQQASPNLAVAAERIAAARAAVSVAGAAAQPQLGVEASAQSGRSDPSLPRSDRLALGAQANWELDLFGRLDAARQASQARLEAALLAWHDGRVSLAAEVASAYVTLRACEAQLAQGELDLQSRAETARLTTLSANAGLLAPADAALARASAASARQQQTAGRLACERQVKALVALSAQPEGTLRERLAPGRGQVPALGSTPLPQVPAALLALRPDLVEAQARLRAAAADVLQAERDQLPRLGLSGQIGVAHSRSVGMSASGSTWSLGPLALTLPLWDGGARAAQQQAAQAAYDSLRTQLEAQVRGAVRDVEQALLALQASQDRQADAQAAVDGFDTALRATQARQRGGVASLFELEDARRQAVAARNVLIELDQQRALAAVSLVRALGGGWRADDAPAPSGPMPASATAGAGVSAR